MVNKMLDVRRNIFKTFNKQININKIVRKLNFNHTDRRCINTMYLQ